MLDDMIEWGKYILLVAGCTILFFCVIEITALRDRVRDLENAAPVYPEITITIPDDWVK